MTHASNIASNERLGYQIEPKVDTRATYLGIWNLGQTFADIFDSSVVLLGPKNQIDGQIEASSLLTTRDQPDGPEHSLACYCQSCTSSHLGMDIVIAPRNRHVAQSDMQPGI